MSIVIVDYGVGNLESIRNMLKRIGHSCQITSDIEDVKNASKLILPGVGAFQQAMTKLERLNMIPALNEAVMEKKVPILGICLGMQLFATQSEEGGLVEGLNWINSTVKKFNYQRLNASNLKVPNVGWRWVHSYKNKSVFKNCKSDPKYYFVHSYYMDCNDSDDVLALSHYGLEFTAAVYKGNITGVQFHPEKSHKYGMKILDEFANDDD